MARASVAIVCSVAGSAAAEDACFERIDNGVDMTGWRKSATNPHGPGDGWTAEGGAFVGRQTSGQQGGILMTDRSYADVEVLFEVKIDWGCDSGFFFRTTGGSRAYQVTIDHVADSSVGTIWGEGFSPVLRRIPYFLTDEGRAAIVAPNQNEQPIFDLAMWPTLWNPTSYNEMRARIEGNPPRIQVWISGTKVMDFTDTMVRSNVDASGPLAIQVHSGSRWIPNGTVAFRNIRVRDLAMTCDDPGTGGSGGAGGMGGGTGGGPVAGNGGAPAGGSAGSGPSAGGGTGGDPAGGATGGGSAGVATSGTGGATGGAPTGGNGGLGGGATTAGAGGTAPGGAGMSDAPTTSGASDGCGCRVAPREGGLGTSLSMLLGLALCFARRRSNVGQLAS
jgi:hypothetical protein